MKENVLFCVGEKMIKNGLLWYLLIYIFVIQMGIIGYLWSDASFYVLAGVNGIALAVGARSFKEKKQGETPEKANGENVSHEIFTPVQEAKEARETNEEAPEKEENEEKKSDFFVRNSSELKDERYHLDEEELSDNHTAKESRSEKTTHIEQVKVRFNKVKSRPQATQQEGGLARFITFLCAIVGRGGVMLVMRQEFDFIAMAIASFLMGIFVLVVYKAMNIWKKSIFSSLYFLVFVILFGGSVVGILADEHNKTKILIKDQISTFFAGLN